MSKIRVAAYCRVSTDHPEQESSLTAQVEHYRKYITSHPDWELADIYAEFASGTNLKKRAKFKRLLRDCSKGKIDMILTKSMSRFGRNTVDTVSAARELFGLGVMVIFEAEGINNFDKEVRINMEMYAAYAQEESRSMSENIKFGIRQRMRDGKVCLNHTRFLGYDKDENGNLIVVESEAKVVRKIFELYLSGFGARKIKRYLEENGIKTVTGKSEWSTSTIDRMLSNEKYMGNVLMQKTFTEDFMTGKRKKNEGEIAMYLIENNHKGIISKEVFERVQTMKAK